MAEEFEGGVIGGNWAWINSSRNLFGSSPCSLATNDRGSFGWPNHDVMEMEMKAGAARSSDDSASASDGPPPTDFEMMGISLLSSTPQDNWSQDLLNDSGRSDQNYSNFLMNSNMNYQHQSCKVDDDTTFDSSLMNTTTNTSTSFPLNSASYNSLLQTLFDTDSQVPQQSLLDYSTNYQTSSNGGFSLPKHSPMLNQQPNNHFPNAPLWNANVPSTNFTHSLPSSLNNKRPNQPSFGAKHQHDQQSKQSGSVAKKGSNDAGAAAFKRPRIETPSPLPTFKVRKEKLGDRITALQQLVSPFGKTDTASVLHEAIEYIKFLHDQVNALSTPYLKYGSPQLQRQQGGDKAKDGEGVIKDLNSRGLCLVPISITFPVASETPSDFWTPTFGGN